MDRSYPSARRSFARLRSQQRRAIGLAGVVIASAIVYAATRPALAPEAGQPGVAASQVGALPQPAALSAAQAGSPRRVYPYSIVPGGVSGAVELARVIRSDRVVAAHYAEFQVDKAEEKTVTTPRAVHVSYRKGDKVYWTAKKVMLAEGEALLSDGTHEMRKRCANRISDTPQFPVEAQGPTEAELDSYALANVAIGEDGVQVAALSAGEAADEGGAGPGFSPGGGGTGFADSATAGAAGQGAPAGVGPAFGGAPGLSAPGYGGSLGGKAHNGASPGASTPGEDTNGGNLGGSGSAGGSGSNGSTPGAGAQDGGGGSLPAPVGTSTTPAAPGSGTNATDSPGSAGGATPGTPSTPGGSTADTPSKPAAPGASDAPSNPAQPPSSLPGTGSPELPLTLPLPVPQPGPSNSSPSVSQTPAGPGPQSGTPGQPPATELYFPPPSSPEGPRSGEAPGLPGLPDLPGLPPVSLPDGGTPKPEDITPFLPKPNDRPVETPAKSTDLPLPGSAWLFALAAGAMALAGRARRRAR